MNPIQSDAAAPDLQADAAAIATPAQDDPATHTLDKIGRAHV